MKILTLQGTDEQIENLLNSIADYNKEDVPTILNITTSENQLKGFLEFKNKGGFKMSLNLRGQGDNSISPAPINLCTVTIDKNDYFFGGISEPFYDKMVKKFQK